MTVAITPLSDALGVEVSGIDLRREMDEETFEAIHDAWIDNVIVLFRGQDLSDEDQERYCNRFGELELVRSTRAQDEDHPSILLISNVEDTGKITALGNGGMLFHYDQCYYEHPAKAAILYAVEVPAVGGHTLYGNCYTAYETLPDDIKLRIEGKRTLNYYSYGDATTRPETPNPEMPQWVHPMVRTVPESGRKALFVCRLMTIRIEGMDKSESDELLDFLFDHMEKPEFIYEHDWRVGDVMMWDNRCSIHARTDFPPEQRRMMRRITVRDPVTVA